MDTYNNYYWIYFYQILVKQSLILNLGNTQYVWFYTVYLNSRVEALLYFVFVRAKLDTYAKNYRIIVFKMAWNDQRFVP